VFVHSSAEEQAGIAMSKRGRKVGYETEQGRNGGQRRAVGALMAPLWLTAR
jgi:cold shock CspA family protein